MQGWRGKEERAAKTDDKEEMRDGTEKKKKAGKQEEKRIEGQEKRKRKEYGVDLTKRREEERKEDRSQINKKGGWKEGRRQRRGGEKGGREPSWEFWTSVLSVTWPPLCETVSLLKKCSYPCFPHSLPQFFLTSLHSFLCLPFSLKHTHTYSMCAQMQLGCPSLTGAFTQRTREHIKRSCLLPFIIPHLTWTLHITVVRTVKLIYIWMIISCIYLVIWSIQTFLNWISRISIII